MKMVGGAKRYGSWAGNPAGRAEDPKRCVADLYDRYHPGGYQCSRARGHGPDGRYCKQHDPAAVAAKNAARDAAYKAKWAAHELRNQRVVAGAAALDAVRLIAAGHNDPRTLALELLARFPTLTADASPAHPDRSSA